VIEMAHSALGCPEAPPDHVQLGHGFEFRKIPFSLGPTSPNFSDTQTQSTPRLSSDIPIRMRKL
jgi:hypothetical protein